MKPVSLSLRLLLAAALSTFVALIITGFAISYLFEVYFQKRLVSELAADLTRLTANLSAQDTGELEVADLGDPRYSQPFGGRYWQIGVDGMPPVLSRSLWDQSIEVTVGETLGQTQVEEVVAPFGADLLAMSWRIVLDGVDAPGGVALTVATDLADLTAASTQFRLNILFWLLLLGVGLVLAAWLQVRVGLKPLDQIREDLEKVALEPEARLPDDYPSEVRPLVETINAQLERQAATLNEARRRAGDLAHGLKTPLTVLEAHAQDIRDDGNRKRANEISDQVASMRYFVERELARSRVSSSSRSSSNLLEITRLMVDAIRKLPDADALTWQIDIPTDIVAPFDRHDLSELLGNLLDNARKYASSRVLVQARVKSGQTELWISDDGPGVSDKDVERIVRPGVQGADSESGYGLGLAIVRDMLALHGCCLGFETSELGGLRVVVSWPENRR